LLWCCYRICVSWDNRSIDLTTKKQRCCFIIIMAFEKEKIDTLTTNDYYDIFFFHILSSFYFLFSPSFIHSCMHDNNSEGIFPFWLNFYTWKLLLSPNFPLFFGCLWAILLNFFAYLCVIF
jgi:hypothetical protein